MRNFYVKIKRNFHHERPLIRLYLFLYFLGLLVGVVAAIALRGQLSAQADLIFRSSSTAAFWSLYFRRLASYFFLYFLGLTVIGVPLLPLYPLYNGFSIGLLETLAVILTGVRGLFFGTLAFLAQNLIQTALGYFICYSSARLSLSLNDLLRGRAKHGATSREFLNHTYRFFIIAAILLLLVLWEWRVAPMIIKLI